MTDHIAEREVDPTDDRDAEIRLLTAELADATARANRLDAQADAARRVARAAHDAQQIGQVLRVAGSDLTTALELWRRVTADRHEGWS